MSNFWMSWDISPDQLLENTNLLINNSMRNNQFLLDLTLSSSDNLRQFLSVLSDDLTEYTSFHSMCSFLQFVSPDALIRKNSSLADSLLTNYIAELNMRSDIYNKIVLFRSIINKSDLFEPIDIQFVDKIIKGYQYNGITLDHQHKLLLLRVKREISKIEHLILKASFNDDNKLFSFDLKQLSGLPSSFLKKLPITSYHPLKYGIALNTPNYTVCMRYIHDPDIRKHIEFLYSTKCIDSLDDLVRLFVLRDKHAKLLSFDNHSNYRSAHLMAQNSDHINSFLTNLLSKLDLRFHKEILTLLRLKQNDFKHRSLPFDNCLNNWDISYYITLWKKEYGLDDTFVKQYFPVEHVIHSTLALYQHLFNLKFVPNNKSSLWHHDVKFFSVFNSSNSLIGHFYADLFARPNKYNQTRCFNLQPNCSYPLLSNRSQLPIAAIVSSFKPKSLLSHNEVVSFFQKFEHIIHCLSGSSKYCLFSSSLVESDFIDTPAFTLSHLCWDHHILSQLSSHHLSKQPLPSHVIDKMIHIRNLNIGIHFKKHIMFAIYDQLLHSSPDLLSVANTLLKSSNNHSSIVSIMTNFYKHLHSQILDPIVFNDGIFMPMPWINFICSADSMYYGHIWSKTLASDLIFSHFSPPSHSRSDPSATSSFYQHACSRLKSNILDFGCNIPASSLLANFLNHEPSINGFLKLHKLDLEDFSDNFSFFFSTDHSYNSPSNLSKSNTNNSNVDNAINDSSNSSSDYSNRFSEIVDDSDTLIHPSSSRHVFASH